MTGAPRSRPRGGRSGRSRAGVLVCAALAAGLLAGSAGASDYVREGGGAAGVDVVPLEDVLARVRESFAGNVLKVELEREEHREGGGWVYEIKVLTPRGNVLKLEYDARTAELLEVKGRRDFDDDDD